MPNFFSAFQSEVFRPLVTLLIPGALAISTWFIALFSKYDSLRQTIKTNRGETTWLLVLLTITIGIMVEDLGSHVEGFFDWIRNRNPNGQHMRIWYSYLRTAYVAEPIGRRYLRTVVLRLKFEFGVSISSFSAVVGILWARKFTTSFAGELGAWLLGLGILVGVLQMIEAYLTHGLLSETRYQMVGDINVIK